MTQKEQIEALEKEVEALRECVKRITTGRYWRNGWREISQDVESNLGLEEGSLTKPVRDPNRLF